MPPVLSASPDTEPHGPALEFEARAPEVTEGDSQRHGRRDAQDEHVGVEQQGVREPPEGVPGQQAERLLTEVQVRVEVSGDKRKPGLNPGSGNVHLSLKMSLKRTVEGTMITLKVLADLI